MNKSYPSAPTTFVDIPEVSEFEATYFYNFFVPDESVNDVGVEIDRNNDDIERKIQRDVPRVVWFTFKPVKLDPRGLGNRNEFRSQNDFNDINSPSIEMNVTKIKFEHELTTTAFTGVRFQDDNLDDKLYIITSGAVERRVANHNRGVERQFNTTLTKIDNYISKNNVNLFDAAKLLSTGYGTHDAKFIVQSLNNLKKINVKFINDSEQQDKLRRRFDKIRDVGLDVQINSKFVSDVLQTIKRDPFGLFADEVGPILEAVRHEQKRTLASTDVKQILTSEYDIDADPIRTRKIDITSFDTRRRVVGYIIDKSEVLNTGEVVHRDSIIIENPSATNAYDVNIAYGRKYIYSIRTITEVELTATMDDSDDVIAASILLSSKQARRRVVDTIEHVPPTPPVDFNVDWDRTKHAARLTWSFPINPQRDIKKWQIFRRASIDEAFELIHEYDFDNSIIRYESGERPSRRLVEMLESPKNFYIDYEFTRTSKYIYAVVAIDAHGMTSNYSTQFEARFDQARNTIMKKLVSSSGAPKPYPNMYVTQDDVLVDVIRDSGHSQVEVYFDPEFLEVTNASNRDLHLLSTDKSGGMYRLQLINTDLQQGSILDIVLRDRRRAKQSLGKAVSRQKTGRKQFARRT